MTTSTIRINLDGEWSLYYFPEGEYKVDHPDRLSEIGLAPIPAQVPGNVELDLFRFGVIPDPFYGGTFQDLRVFETYEWWYTRTFMAPEAINGHHGVELVLAGLDTLGSVWINGKMIGKTDNMLIEHRLSVDNLVSGENRIAVQISSAVNRARQYQYEPAMMSWENREEGMFIRKAPHVWGWDIMPRIVSAGIWRSISIETTPKTGFDHLYYWTAEISETGATLGVWFQFHTLDSDLSGYDLHFHGVCRDHEFQFVWPVEFLSGRCMIPIPDVRLWWPKGYGDSHLYTVTVQLRRHEQVLAERVDTIGIRKVVVDRTELAGAAWKPEPVGNCPSRVDQPPCPESHFVIYVNDVLIMVKGTNWVPLDAYHSRDAGRLDQAMALVNDLGCNMVRCWGGNVYEDHAFFDFCDRHGILVWQDFAFACCRYPQTDEFLTRVRAEAESIVRKLHNHPSLVIWCGDNEIDMAYLSDGLSPEENRISREVLPQVVHRLDPQRAYIPSSPYAPPAVVNSKQSWSSTPEQHLWGPRGYYKSPFYTDHSAHFIGEIGYHGCPHVTSIQRFISPDKRWPWQNNDEWQVHAVYHWKHDAIDRHRIQLMANQIRELFGTIPDNLRDFALASQITQAEAKKFFIESTRLRKWGTSGILWWNVLDGWPQFSDAVVDYYFAKKLAYHYIRRVQQPVCVFIGEPRTGTYLPVIASNDSREPVELQYRVWDADLGETTSEGAFKLPANQNWQIDLIRIYASDQRMYLINWTVDGNEYGNHYLVGNPPVDLIRYQEWLPMIANLPHPFDVTEFFGE